MSSKVKLLILVAVIITCGVGLVIWKDRVGGHGDALTKITKEEMEMLVKDLNPMQQRMLAENAEQKKELAKNLQEFLAIANQARKEGFAEKPEVKQELKYMKKAILALSYDKVKNKDKPMPPLSMITEDQISEFWGETGGNAQKTQEDRKAGPEPPEAESTSNVQKDKEVAPPAAEEKENAAKPSPQNSPQEKEEQSFVASIFSAVGLGWAVENAEKRQREAEFHDFLEAQKKLEKERGQRPEGQEMTEEQVKQMRDSFARFSIYEKEAKSKLDELGEEFLHKVEFQTKLQQSQLLAQLYAREKLVPKLDVSEKEIAEYIDKHPELTKEKKAKADEILRKAKDGEDFENLAKEFSEDPGSKEQGGLYENVPVGQMIPEFEKAAMALKPGQISPNLVRTKFGYHIIKLEKKGETKGPDGKTVASYDARHILITTSVKDQDNPMQQEVPLDTFVSNKLKKEKQDTILAEILKNNPIEVAMDFEVTPPAIPQQPQLPPGMQLPPQNGEQPPEEAPEPKTKEKADKR